MRPNGLGFFLDSHDMAQPPADVAAKLLKAGATWAGVLIMSVDGRRQPMARIRAIVAALRAADILPYIFAFPPPGNTKTALDWIEVVAADQALPRVLLDLEPYDENGDKKIDASEDWSQAQYDFLIDGLRAANIFVIVSIFRRARWASIKWRGVPVAIQAYSSWQATNTFEALMRWARALDGVTDVMVTGETYKATAYPIARLNTALSCVGATAKATGCLSIWSLHTTSTAEAETLLDWALALWGPPAR